MQITEQEAEEKKAVERRKAEYSKWSLAGYCADFSEQMGNKWNKSTNSYMTNSRRSAAVQESPFTVSSVSAFLLGTCAKSET